MRHPKVQERRELSAWSEGEVWGSPERPRIMKAQIDWIPLSVGSICATQGKSLAVMQVGWFSVLRCHQYPPAARLLDAHDHDPQTSVAKAYQEYDGNGRMKPSSHYDRVVDLCEELMKFTLLTRRPISSTDTASARKTRRSRNSASNSSRSDHQRVFDNIRIPSDTEMRSAMP